MNVRQPARVKSVIGNSPPRRQKRQRFMVTGASGFDVASHAMQRPQKILVVLAWWRLVPVAALSLGWLSACAAEEPRPPKAPQVDVSRPVILLPADMDLVLRLDVSRYREASGQAADQALEKTWREFLLDTQNPHASAKSVAPALSATDTLWLGCRLGSQGCKDFVAVLRGHFANQRQSYGFDQTENKRDLGGGWLSFDHGTTERDTVARVYFKPPELAVLVSSAEVDSAERSVEQGLDPTELLPRESGLLSIVVHSHALAHAIRERSAKAADWLDASERVEIQVEPEAADTRLTFAVTFPDAPRAARAAQALKIIMLALTRFEPRLKGGDVRVEQLDRDVVLRLLLARGMADTMIVPPPDAKRVDPTLAPE